MLMALFLIIIGTVFLLKNLGIISVASWSIIWPLILIALGVYVAFKSYKIMLLKHSIKRKLKFWKRFSNE